MFGLLRCRWSCWAAEGLRGTTWALLVGKPNIVTALRAKRLFKFRLTKGLICLSSMLSELAQVHSSLWLVCLLVGEDHLFVKGSREIIFDGRLAL